MKSRMVTIGEASKALKEGKRVRRFSWNSEKKFIFMQVPSIINAEIVPKMQSLTNYVKAYFGQTFQDENEQINAIYYHDQVALVGLSNSIQGYSFSNADVLAEDWEILD